MLQSAINIWIYKRERLAQRLRGLRHDQWFTVPAGFANNIAWNVGHLNVSQQDLVYTQAGLPTYLPAEQRAWYFKGTSPTDWPSEPNIDQLLEEYLLLPYKLREDVSAGLFDGVDYRPLQLRGGFEFKTINDGIAYTFDHEGEHRGMIYALMQFV